VATTKTKRALRNRLPGAVYGGLKRLYWSQAANGLRRASGRTAAALHPGRFGHVHTVLLFIGYPRSGHSLIGSLLNAHPRIVVAHELHALWYVDRGFSRTELFSLIWRRDRWFGRHNRQWTEFNYSVPGQWQGASERLEVIGDKKGDGVTDLLQGYPGLLEAARTVLGSRVRIIHTVRNPYDNVATMARRTGDPLSQCIERHRNRTALNAELIERLGDDTVLTVRHEDVIANPAGELERICAFLDLEAPEDYTEACSGIIYRSPHLSRHRVAWNNEDRAAVERIIARTPFLSGYRFDE
jgi:hypothetical protein